MKVDIYENATKCYHRISVVSVKQTDSELTIKSPQTPVSRSVFLELTGFSFFSQNTDRSPLAESLQIVSV